MAHSKRNTSRPVFTSFERSLAKSAWRTSSAQLTRESFLPFGSCILCLEPAQDPVSCSRGHILCRECILSNMLAQKRDAKRLLHGRMRAAQEDVKARELEDSEIQAQAVKQFEMAQIGLEEKGNVQGGGGDNKRYPDYKLPSGIHGRNNSGHGNKDKNEPAEVTAVKRKHAVLDEDEVDKSTEEAKAKARKTLSEAKAAEESAKPLSSTFWTPTAPVTAALGPVSTALSTDGAAGVGAIAGTPAESKPKQRPVCPASEDQTPHNISLSSLITVHFTTSGNGARVCPSCLKQLSNSLRPVLFRTCGHSLCRNCTEQLFKQSGDSAIACNVCDVLLFSPDAASGDKQKRDRRSNVLDLRVEGTGFSARGSNRVVRPGVAFQC